MLRSSDLHQFLTSTSLTSRSCQHLGVVKIKRYSSLSAVLIVPVLLLEETTVYCNKSLVQVLPLTYLVTCSNLQEVHENHKSTCHLRTKYFHTSIHTCQYLHMHQNHQDLQSVLSTYCVYACEGPSSLMLVFQSDIQSKKPKQN